MNPSIERMFNDAEGRYLEATEQSTLTEFATSLELRLLVMREIEANESVIIESTVDALFIEHPELLENHPQAREKAVRDMTLVLRYVALSVVRDSGDFLRGKLLTWFRTIIVAFEMQHALDFAYKRLIDETKKHLAPEPFGLVEPYLQLVHTTITK